MLPTAPSTITTLVINAAFRPSGFFSARSSIKNLMVGGVKAYDSHGNIHDWASWIAHDYHLDEAHPALRSVDTLWAVPTIVIVPGYFGHGRKRGKVSQARAINLRQLYYIYDGECQYCLKKIPYTSATRDHLVPRSRGGGNSDDNIVLSCKKCNMKKSNNFPYFNIHGSEVKPKALKDIEFTAISERVTIREEWKTFLV
jgi:hypothetical protein